jgi:hypothetical protein
MRIRAESDASDVKRNFRVHTAQGFKNAAFRLSLTPRISEKRRRRFELFRIGDALAMLS